MKLAIRGSKSKGVHDFFVSETEIFVESSVIFDFLKNLVKYYFNQMYKTYCMILQFSN